MGDYTKSDNRVLGYAMVITPTENVDMTGRAPVFLIHGGDFGQRCSSLGCIVLPPEARVTIGTTGITDLEVVR